MTPDIAALYEAHHHEILALVSRHMNGAAAPDADDVAAQVWVRAMQATYRDDGKPRAWLFTIARNLITDYYRSGAWRFRVRALPAHELLDEHHPSCVDRYPSAYDDLRAALDGLPPPQRNAVVLRFWYGLQSPEIGRLVGISGNGVKQQHKRAFARMRKSLEAA